MFRTNPPTQAQWENVRSFANKRLSSFQDSQDIAQTAFLNALRSNEVPSNPHGYLKAIARRLVLDFYRKRKPKALPDNLCTPDVTESEVLRNELQARVHKALEAIPPQYAELVRSVYLAGELPESIARRLAIPLGTLKSRLYTARQLLAAELRPVS